jgi:hypothetical protein
MKQYCRYCANLVYGDSCYCEVKRKCLNYDSCKRPNKCKNFELNPIDALAENPREYAPREYAPREKKKPLDQVTIFDINGRSENDGT